MTDPSGVNTTIRRIGAVLTVLLAANVHLLVRSTDAYQVGTAHHAIFAWVSLAGFWLGSAYLAGSIGYAVVEPGGGEPLAAGGE